MKKQGQNLLLAILVGGLILLYVINPSNKQLELNGWYTFILIGIVIFRAVNKNKMVDVIIRIFGACFFLYLVLYYFL
jgi:hypothetical protein